MVADGCDTIPDTEMSLADILQELQSLKDRVAAFESSVPEKTTEYVSKQPGKASSSALDGASEAGSTLLAYTGRDMKYFIRAPLRLSEREFRITGKNLTKRTHLVDLRCPALDFSDASSGAKPAFDGIRVNSWAILKALAAITPDSEVGYSAASVPYVFWRPFTFFIHILDDLAEYAEQLRMKYNDSKGVAGTHTVDYANFTPLGAGGIQLEESDEERELNDLEHFIWILHTELSEDLERMRRMKKAELPEVTFEELSLLFSPGDYIVNYKDKAYRGYRILSLSGGLPLALPHEEVKVAQKSSKVKEWTPLHIDAYYLDFEGDILGGVRKNFVIQRYEGALPVRQLLVYPMDYLDKAKKEALATRGERFLGFLKIQATGQGSHRYYEGLTLDEIMGSKEDVQYVDSQAIIDQGLALIHKPEWDPILILGKPTERSPDESPASALSGLSYVYGMQKDPEEVDIAERWKLFRNRRSFYEQEAMLKRLFDIESITEQVSNVTHKMKHILHRRVFGFVLRNRRWVSLDIDLIQDVTMQSDGFKNLVLPPGHSELVQALVEMHSPGSRGGSKSSKEVAQVDLVRGKGKGLIILLHGAPGVGKSSTAECVAEYAKRPLFPITCGDIGHEPKDVEANLESSFRLAHKWGCVLLLDEADIFLQKRDKQDLKRNSLVSVFLRVLEFYSGILFLTTNRVGTFDEAFKSRIHVSLYYPPLNHEAYLAVWRMNIERMKEINKTIEIQDKRILKYAEQSYEKLHWNGRQIRNAFQTAFALAEFSAKEIGVKSDASNRPTIIKLTKAHFRTVAKAAAEFEHYLTDIYGGQDDGDRARLEQVRVDRTLRPIPNGPGPKSMLLDDGSSSSDSSSDSLSDSEVGKKKKKKRSKKSSRKSKRKSRKASSSEETSSSDSESEAKSSSEVESKSKKKRHGRG